VDIKELSAIVEKKIRRGDGEGDTITGHKGALLTLVDRKSKYTIRVKPLPFLGTRFERTYEHTNGLIRQYLLHSTDFTKVTHSVGRKIENKLNNRPSMCCARI
jgi:IS30 family transposase